MPALTKQRNWRTAFSLGVCGLDDKCLVASALLAAEVRLGRFAVAAGCVRADEHVAADAARVGRRRERRRAIAARAAG
eukprot:2429626-Pleurochrysis_carterae.AAC.1